MDKREGPETLMEEVVQGVCDGGRGCNSTRLGSVLEC